MGGIVLSIKPKNNSNGFTYYNSDGTTQCSYIIEEILEMKEDAINPLSPFQILKNGDFIVKKVKIEDVLYLKDYYFC